MAGPHGPIAGMVDGRAVLEIPPRFMVGSSMRNTLISSRVNPTLLTLSPRCDASADDQEITPLTHRGALVDTR